MATEGTIWLYWEDPPGGRRPGYIELCLESIKAHAGSHEVVLLSPNNIDDYVNGLIPGWVNIPIIAHKADYIRAKCLAQNGGMWLDIDSIVLLPLDLVFQWLSFRDLVTYGWRPGQPSIGMLAATPSSDLLMAWSDEIEWKLEQSLQHSWSGVGYDLLWPLAESASFVQFSHQVCAPAHWTQTGLFGEDKPAEDLLADDTVMVQLYNKGLSSKMGRLTPEEIMSTPTVLSGLVHESRNRSRDFSKLALTMVQSNMMITSIVENNSKGRFDVSRAVNVVEYRRLSRAFAHCDRKE